jgi:hypothetical protein
MQIVNNKKPTVPKSKNILDLTTLLIELMKYFNNFQVLKKIHISDHYPTLTTLIEAKPCVVNDYLHIVIFTSTPSLKKDVVSRL